MPTTSVVNASDLEFYVNGTAIGHAQDAQISITHEPRDITSKQSGAWKEFAPGMLSWSISGSSLFAFDATEGFDEHFADITNRTKVEVRFSTEVSSDNRYYGDVYFTSLDANSAGTQDNVSYSFAGTGTGAIASEAVS